MSKSKPRIKIEDLPSNVALNVSEDEMKKVTGGAYELLKAGPIRHPGGSAVFIKRK